jgi:hypothetical protein
MTSEIVYRIKGCHIEKQTDQSGVRYFILRHGQVIGQEGYASMWSAINTAIWLMSKN